MVPRIPAGETRGTRRTRRHGMTAAEPAASASAAPEGDEVIVVGLLILGFLIGLVTAYPITTGIARRTVAKMLRDQDQTWIEWVLERYDD